MCKHVFVNTDEAVHALDGLFTLSNAMHRAFLRHIAEFDREEGWREDGAHDMYDWCSFRYGTSAATARQFVDIAHALEVRPAIAAAYEAGRLTWEKLVDLCSFVPPEEDERWAHDAQLQNAAQVKLWAKHARRMRREEAQRAAKERSLRMYWDRHRAVLHLTAVLPGAEGATVRTAIERIAERFGPNEDGTWAPHHRREADALIEMAANELANDSDADRATVVVHVDAQELNHIHGVGKLQDGPMISSEVVRRLACDGRIQAVIDGPDGHPIGVGRTQRTVSPWLLRQLKHRDGGCVVNGCGRTLGVQAHHVIHWAHGGRTDLDNLVLVCRRCHRKIHDEGFRLVRDQYGRVRVIRPDGRPVTPHPAPLSPDVRARFVGPPTRRSSTAMRC
jgi:uncharacterized protein DUF222/HNH endonuclease